MCLLAVSGDGRAGFGAADVVLVTKTPLPALGTALLVALLAYGCPTSLRGVAVAVAAGRELASRRPRARRVGTALDAADSACAFFPLGGPRAGGPAAAQFTLARSTTLFEGSTKS